MKRLKIIERTEARTAIALLCAKAQSNDDDNRRNARRFPFFQPVSISTPGSLGRDYSAFARDISESGIGLLHVMPLPEGTVDLMIETADGFCVVPAKIAWCRSAGDGWYMSGAEFIN